MHLTIILLYACTYMPKRMSYLFVQCNGQPIKWQFIQEVYEQNLGSSSNVGISMVQKLTLEHLNLTSFSKMRVDLVSQVCKYVNL